MATVRGARTAQLERWVMLAYVLVVIWVLLGRPDLRVRLLYLTRKALRRLAAATASAAQAVEDQLLDIATNSDTNG